MTALQVASISGGEAVVQALLAAGAEVGLQAKDGNTPLFVASMNGGEDVVNVL